MKHLITSSEIIVFPSLIAYVSFITRRLPLMICTLPSYRLDSISNSALITRKLLLFEYSALNPGELCMAR